MVIVIAFLAFMGMLLVVPFMLEGKRRRALVRLDGPHQIERAIVDRKLFEGMSDRQLHEAWGPPEEIAIDPHGRVRKETWLYGGDGRGRFRDHIHLHDGVVVKWKQLRVHGRH